MVTSLIGTIVDGAIQLDRPIVLADNSRVQVIVRTLDDWQERCRQALAALDELKAQPPISSGGLKFTREQLYERS